MGPDAHQAEAEGDALARGDAKRQREAAMRQSREQRYVSNDNRAASSE